MSISQGNWHILERVKKTNGLGPAWGFPVLQTLQMSYCMWIHENDKGPLLVCCQIPEQAPKISRRLIHYMVIVLSITLTSAMAFAADPPCDPRDDWSTFGEVSVDLVAKKDGIEHRSHFRFVVFENRESLTEITDEGVRKRMLRLPGSVSAYEGLTPDEDTGISPKNPFSSGVYAFAVVFGPLSSAFPCGIESVPDTAQQIKVTSDGARFEGSVVRLSDDQIRYRFTMERSGNNITHVTGYDGVWKKRRAAPLPDDFLIRGWRLTHKNFPVAGVTTVGQARGLARVSPP